MNLDDLNHIHSIDSADMLSQIDTLPDQLEQAWKQGQSLPLPAFPTLRQVVIAGMGGSAIGADLFAAWAEPLLTVPVIVQRDYSLPGWARGPETLVIASSHSGNTEETLSAFQQAYDQGCSLLALATGGALAEGSRANGIPTWTFAHKGQPRAAVGFSFGLLLALFARLGLIPNPEAELQDALAAMRSQQESLRAAVPTVHNPAKRQALQMINRWVTVMASEALLPVARRWKGQVNELAKAYAAFEALPEANHNTLAGLAQPENGFQAAITIFLNAPSCHPRNQLRNDLTRKTYMLDGKTTDFFIATGNSRMAHQWTMLHLGDYTAYYLAICYGIDPTPIDMLVDFKNEMGNY